MYRFGQLLSNFCRGIIMRIAIIGSGIAGLSAAWLLNRRHQITLYERNDYFGGHTNTRMVETQAGAQAVDTGFIVFNRRNYPLLARLFEHLGVETQPTRMSFSVSVNDGRYEYAGSGPATLFGQRRNLLNVEHYRMLAAILRFNRDARRLLEVAETHPASVEEFITAGDYGDAFRNRYLLPMAAAIWSCPVETMAAFPAASLVRFFANHGLLDLRNRPQWRTVCGGSHQYVKQLLEPLRGRLACRDPVTAVRRTSQGATVYAERSGARAFDAVVLACHADQALQILDQPTARERSLLGAFRYQHNRALLHSDTGLMPRRRSVWSAWNYLAAEGHRGTEAVSVSYWMNCLQRLDQAPPLFVSLNPLREPRTSSVFAEMEYSHPVFDRRAITAQSQLHNLQGENGIWYCGSYFGYGFHEDALRSSVELARSLGVEVPWARDTAVAAQIPAAPRPAWAGQ
jgi:predicted NAD/FAD-binding protein